MATEELQGEELDAILTDLERKIERLRIGYEQFFLGMEKIVPSQRQKDVVRIIYRLQAAKLRGAQAKFRFQSLVQRFNSHKAYWNRTVREIEAGTYKRQTFRAKQRERITEFQSGEHLTAEDYLAIRMIKEAQGDEAAAAAEEARRAKRQAEAEAAEDFMRQMAGGSASGATPSTGEADQHAGAADHAGAPSGESPKRDPSEIRGMSADEVAAKADKMRALRDRMRAGAAELEARRAAQRPGDAPRQAAPPRDVDRDIFERFVAAKRQLNQTTDSLSFDAVKASLDKQRAKVRQKHDCARVDFDIVVKDGNAFLKPIPVKDV